MKKMILCGVAAAVVGLAAQAQAGGFSLRIGVPGVVLSLGGPGMVHPAPVCVRPVPVWVPAPLVVMVPPPFVVCPPPPVVYGPPGWRHHGEFKGRHHHRHAESGLVVRLPGLRR